MLRVFHLPGSRSQRVVWMAEEMGLPYQTEPANLRQPTRDLLAVNPAATLPAVVDGDVTMTESVAILQYLAERYGPTDLSVKPGEAGHSDYLQFLVFGEASLAAPLNPVIGTMFFAPEDQRGDNVTTQIAKEGFIRRMKLVERRLERSDYMAADRFTAADISVAYAIGVGAWIGLADRLSKPVLDYHARVTARPAYQRIAPPSRA